GLLRFFMTPAAAAFGQFFVWMAWIGLYGGDALRVRGSELRSWTIHAIGQPLGFILLLWIIVAAPSPSGLRKKLAAIGLAVVGWSVSMLAFIVVVLHIAASIIAAVSGAAHILIPLTFTVLALMGAFGASMAASRKALSWLNPQEKL